MRDIEKVMKCISSSQTPEQIESCKRLRNNLIRKYKKHSKEYKSNIIVPYVLNINLLIEQKSNVWT